MIQSIVDIIGKNTLLQFDGVIEGMTKYVTCSQKDTYHEVTFRTKKDMVLMPFDTIGGRHGSTFNKMDVIEVIEANRETETKEVIYQE